MSITQTYIAGILLCYMFVCRGDGLTACKTCSCSHDKTFGGILVRCSDLGLSSLPAGIPGGATTLLLDGNYLKNLRSGTFSRLKRLKLLDMSGNKLQRLPDNAFYGLSDLWKLNLEGNQLLLSNKTYSRGLFKPLSKLQILKLNNNSNPLTLPSEASYPDASLRYLTSLQELFIDGIPASFGPGFKSLKDLKNLSLSGSHGFCRLPILKNSTFINVPYVEVLNISNCQTADSEPLTFSPLKHIHTLDVSFNRDLGFDNFSKATYGLRFSPLRILKLNFIYPQYGSCSHLKVEHITHLNNTPLLEFHVDGNGIIGMDDGAVMNFPNTLEVISAKENRFSYGSYILNLHTMESLRYVDASYLNRWHPLPFKRDVSYHSMTFAFPPKLETLVLSRCYLRGVIHPGKVTKNSLKKVYLDHNLINSILGPMYGYNKVEYVDFSHNSLNFIQKDSFSTYSLTYLDLSYNNLGECFSEDSHGQIFKGLTKLFHLNISANNIYSLPQHLFDGLRHLQTLTIAHNDIDFFDTPLRQFTHLRYLDLAHNKLQSLSSKVRFDLDHLDNVTVRLEGNTLSCTCNDIDFLRWMQKKSSMFKDLNTIVCMLSNQKRIHLTDLDTVVFDLEEQCRSYVGFFQTSVTLFVFIMICMALGSAYRYRWKLRRMYFIGGRKRNQEINDESIGYKYDAFVSYADDDIGFVKNVMIEELERKAGLRLCIRDRDFIPGTVIASNVVNAILNSRKALLILSTSYMKRDWCQYEYNMAQVEGVVRRENVIVGVQYGLIQNMPNDMALMFVKYPCLEYDLNGHDNEIFWQNMIVAIQTPDPDGN